MATNDNYLEEIKKCVFVGRKSPSDKIITEESERFEEMSYSK